MSVPARGTIDRKELALTFLRLANDQYQQHRLHRVSAARLARRQGLTNQDIADAYGVTETSIRSLLKRAKPAPTCATCKDSVRPSYYCPDCGLSNPNEGR